MGSLNQGEWPTPRLEQSPDDHNVLNLAKLVRALTRHKKAVVSVVVLAVAGAYGVVSQLPPLYQSEAVLMIEPRKSQVTDTQRPVVQATVDASTIRTEAEVLRSIGLAKVVVETLALQSNPNFLKAPGLFSNLKATIGRWFGVDETPAQPGEQSTRAQPAGGDENSVPPDLQDVTIALRDRITVFNDGRSAIIKVRFESDDAELSARIVNTYMHAYIAQQLDAKSAATVTAAQLLNERADELRDKVAESDRAVQIFRDEHRLTEARGVTVIGQQLAELNSQFVVAVAERITKEARLQELRAAGDSPTPESLASPILLRLKEQQSELMRQEAELAASAGPNLPALAAIRAKRTEGAENIARELEKIVGAAAQDVESARRREVALRQALGDLESRAHDLDKSQVQLRQLEREANADHELYQHFLRRAKETGAQKYLQEPDARIISEALVPKVPTFPKTWRILGLAGCVSIVAAVALALVLERMDHSYINAEELERETDVFSLGVVPEVRSGRGGQHAIVDQPPALFSESIRWVRTSLEHGAADRAKVVLITSAKPNEGKSTFSVALARSAAQAGQRALLIDCDLRMSSASRLLGPLPGGAGLHAVLESAVGLEEAIRRDPRTSLDYIAEQPGAANPQALLGSHAMADLLHRLRDAYDVIILDAPPVLPVSDARVLAKIADGVILLVRWNVTPRSSVQRALHELRKVRGNVIGMVLYRAHLRKGGISQDRSDRIYGLKPEVPAF